MPITKERLIHNSANKAKRLLALFYDKTDLQTSVVDCVTDLMHLCHREGWDFEDALGTAQMHFTEERTEG